MTAETIAAALLKDVKRHGGWYALDPVPVMYEADVLAALTAALNGVDERAETIISALQTHGSGFHVDDDLQRWIIPTTDLITSLLAQIAALRANTVQALDEADREYIRKTNELIERHAEQLAALRAERDDALTFLDNAVSKAPEPLKALGKYLAGRLDEDEWPTAEQYLNAAAKACADRTDAAEAKVEKLRGAAAWAMNHVSTLPMDEATQSEFMRHRAALTTEADNG